MTKTRKLWLIVPALMVLAGLGYWWLFHSRGLTPGRRIFLARHYRPDHVMPRFESIDAKIDGQNLLADVKVECGKQEKLALSFPSLPTEHRVTRMFWIVLRHPDDGDQGFHIIDYHCDKRVFLRQMSREPQEVESFVDLSVKIDWVPGIYDARYYLEEEVDDRDHDPQPRVYLLGKSRWTVAGPEGKQGCQCRPARPTDKNPFPAALKDPYEG